MVLGFCVSIIDSYGDHLVVKTWSRNSRCAHIGGIKMVYHYELKVNGVQRNESSVGTKELVMVKMLQDIAKFGPDIDSFEMSVVVKRGTGPEVWKK